jgi:4-hydroxybenzoate polyprenyltransferase
MFFAFGMHPVFLVFLAGIGILLIVEHRLVNPRDLSRIDMAFFHMNSVVSVVLFIGVITEVLLR